jgi:quinoprotein glucose dehydrogenase
MLIASMASARKLLLNARNDLGHRKWARRCRTLLLLGTLACVAAVAGGRAAALPSDAIASASAQLLARSNLVAWCIVPFDAKKRGPIARAEMLQRLGIRLFAYDYREEHIPTFDAEIEALKQRGITLLAWWFPTVLNDEAKLILNKLRQHKVRAQLWVTGGGGPTRDQMEQIQRVKSEAERIRAIAEAAAEIGCTVAFYNHGGWFGDPLNQIAIIERLRSEGVTNVSIVYNLHHGHDDLARFPELLRRMQPYLTVLNFNGMVADGEQTGRKIIPIGQGDRDLELLRTILQSGWRGPIGILNHTDEDAEARLQDNLDGLEWLKAQLEGRVVGPKPKAKSWRNYWSVEDPGEREKLPLYETIPAAKPDELTPANRLPKRESFLSWHRSHGDGANTRYSTYGQINRDNVTNLTVAWIYHSRDGKDNIQCNPIIVNGIMYAPSPGKYIVAVNAETGVELWRFKPEGRPAFRGLLFWAGGNGIAHRVMFCSGPYLYALDPGTGKALASFGQQGRVTLPGRAQGDFGAATAAPAVFEKIIVVPGFEKDVWGFDIVSGHQLWTFHTVPEPGEFGYDTWDQPEQYSANCWGGMAMDEARGIVYITTGSPKPNFVGMGHRGRNLFANCVVALDARTGKRLWHFQEIPHDIWDLDIPAPPNLATITRDGRKVDVVTAVTKIGNTLLLDRVTGKPIFPFRLRRAPTSEVPGEETWPYQPDAELPERFSTQEFKRADLTDRSEEATEWSVGQFVSARTGFFQPCSEGRANLFFGIDGGAEWTGACIDPETGRLYVSANHMGWVISLFRDGDPPFDPSLPRTRGQEVYELTCARCHGTNKLGISVAPPLRGLRFRSTDEVVTRQIREGKNSMPAQLDLSEADLKALLDYLMLRDRALPKVISSERPRYSVSGYPKFYDFEGYPANKPPWGTLNCLDLNTGKLVWRVPLGEYPALAAQGIKNTGTENYGGATVTAGGLVFCSGTRDHKIRAFDKDTGQELWSAVLPYVGNAPPSSCMVNGRQLIIIAATGANKLVTPYGDAYVAFALRKNEEDP